MVSTGIYLPRPVQAHIRSFSLYGNTREITAAFGTGVFCLAGANGLGKSTFLSAIGFAITGVVADPGRAFNSADEYLTNCRAYSNSAFDGRITEDDRVTAEVELVMRVRHAEYRIIRNMFEPTALRALEVNRDDRPSLTVVDTESDEERHVAYEQMLIVDVGVQSFSQLVMLHYLVQTFDERRHLLFWDDKVSQAAFFLAFGHDAEHAKRADDLRRQAERADSRARNYQFAATTARRSQKELAARLESLSEDEDDPRDAVRTLQKQADEAKQRESDASARHRDANLRMTDIASTLRSTRAEYERVYGELVFGRRDPENHPVIQSIVAGSKCSVCGSSGDSVAAHVLACLASRVCPVCKDSVVAGQDTSQELDQLDSSIRLLSTQHVLAEDQVKRYLKQLEIEEETLKSIRKSLHTVEDDLGTVIFATGDSRRSVERVMADYQREIEARMKQKDEERLRRDQYRDQLRELQDSLARNYREVEAEFVPMFATLAREFLGLELELDFEITMEVSRLVLSVGGTARRGAINLSESQRFFVDIALRMALTRQLSAEDSTPTLYVDTPEGSLDIAYERRAGSMFAQFVEGGGQLLMTANINTSELLLNLAETCTSTHMRLQRMTDWATLSEVQVAEQDSFDRAFRQVEQRLTSAQ